jgi:hypothetical protein
MRTDRKVNKLWKQQRIARKYRNCEGCIDGVRRVFDQERGRWRHVVGDQTFTCTTAVEPLLRLAGGRE